MINVRRHFAGVFTNIKSIAFNRGVGGEAVCEGFWSLDVGVYKGESLRRQRDLERTLATLDKGGGSIELWHAHDRREHCVRLLIRSATGASEFRWELLAGESVDGFRDGLARAAAIHLRNVPAGNRREIDLYAYGKEFPRHGPRLGQPRLAQTTGQVESIRALTTAPRLEEMFARAASGCGPGLPNP